MQRRSFREWRGSSADNFPSASVDDIPVHFPLESLIEATGLSRFDSEMLFPNSGNLCLNAHLHCRLGLVSSLESWGHVAFAVLASEDERMNVFQLPCFPWLDLPACQVAYAAVGIENALADPWRDFLIIVFSDPFIYCSH